MHVGGPLTVRLVGGPDGRRAALAAAGVAVGGPSCDVVVVDVDDAGAAAVADAVAAAGGAAVLAVSAVAEHADVLAAVRAGATGFVTPAEVVAAVGRIAAGETVFSPGLAAVVLEARGGPAEVRLTERETEVVALVVEGLTARQIATRLVLSPRTVENHVQNLLRKLHLPNRAALVRYAIENGLA